MSRTCGEGRLTCNRESEGEGDAEREGGGEGDGEGEGGGEGEGDGRVGVAQGSRAWRCAPSVQPTRSSQPGRAGAAR